jgi:hypothetical protein
MSTDLRGGSWRGREREDGASGVTLSLPGTGIFERKEEKAKGVLQKDMFKPKHGGWL